jgi:hypothetical protein
MGVKEVLLLMGAIVLCVVGSCMMGGSRSAHCDNWVCVGPCGGPGQCAGYGCVCVGYSTGVGRCVSE